MLKYTHTHAKDWPWLFFFTVLSSVEQTRKALQGCEEKCFKFKANFWCRHLQMHFLSLCLSLPLSTTLLFSSMLYGGCIYPWFFWCTMNMQCDPLSIPVGTLCLISALLPTRGGWRSEIGFLLESSHNLDLVQFQKVAKQRFSCDS